LTLRDGLLTPNLGQLRLKGYLFIRATLYGFNWFLPITGFIGFKIRRLKLGKILFKRPILLGT